MPEGWLGDKNFVCVALRYKGRVPWVRLWIMTLKKDILKNNKIYRWSKCFGLYNLFLFFKSWKDSSLDYTAWKISLFGIFLVRINSECGKIRSRKTPNTDTFHEVLVTRRKWCLKYAKIFSKYEKTDSNQQFE